MALSILDGNQSATTLSTILSSGQHITAHTVVSLGTQAITDMQSAVSGSVVSISNFPSSQVISGTVTANPTGTQTIAGTVTANGIASNEGEGVPDKAVWMAYNLNNNLQGVSDSAPLPISGTVTANIPLVNIQPTVTTGLGVILLTDEGKSVFDNSSSIKATLTTALPAGTNRIGVVTIGNIQRAGDSVQSSLLTEAGSGYLLNRSYLGAGVEQIGSVTASISGTVPISISSVTVGNSVTIGSLPAISGTVTANTFALQGTAVTTSNFTSTTASTVLASFNATREVLTIFNEGAGNLHICAGATCTTIAYQVRLSAGDYYEVPNHQTTITHSAVFATAGTARVTQIS
jgi:hypothetical protein